LGERSDEVALFSVRDILKVTGASLQAGQAEGVVLGVTSDSRQVTPGDLFVAIKGERVDGHAFVRDAFENGARAALVSSITPEMTAALGAPAKALGQDLPAPALILTPDPVRAMGALSRWYRQKFDVRVVGITGSVGKTTTKDMTASILSTRFRTLRNRGNLNTEVGVPLTLFHLRQEHEVAVIEMAMRGPGQIGYLAQLAEPTVGVLTNIGEAHLETLGSVENIARTKAELLSSLPPTGLAVLNRDSPWVVRMGDQHRGEKVWYSVHQPADYVATDIVSMADQGMEFTLVTPKGIARVRESLPGYHNVSNALAAAAVGIGYFGLSLQDVKTGLDSMESSGSRSEVLEIAGFLLINDTYNSSPASSRAALAVLKDLARGRRTIAVLGDMLELGTYARLGHVEVGENVAKHGIDILITMGEWSRHIASAARAQGTRVIETDDHESATRALLDAVRPQDVVLVKGSRGMHMEDVVHAVKAHFGLGGVRRDTH
jgi:UDP-N-acetylmuramoyl-tripeptide--D-alanyl-D-alanine ligase